MNLIVGTDIGATHVTLTAPGQDIYITVTNPAATVSQVQTAISKLSSFVGGLGAAGSTVASHEGIGGATSN